MKPFRFSIERALGWRRTQLEVAEAEFKRRAAAIGDLDQARSDLDAVAVSAAHQVLAWPDLDGHDLSAMGEFHRYILDQRRRMAERRVALERRLEEQRCAMLEAQRRCRLLERLRERRLTEWKIEAGRELENFATEAFLARWPREPRHG